MLQCTVPWLWGALGPTPHRTHSARSAPASRAKNPGTAWLAAASLPPAHPYPPSPVLLPAPISTASPARWTLPRTPDVRRGFTVRPSGPRLADVQLKGSFTGGLGSWLGLQPRQLCWPRRPGNSLRGPSGPIPVGHSGQSRKEGGVGCRGASLGPEPPASPLGGYEAAPSLLPPTNLELRKL